MANPSAPPEELARLRREYETSLSWRLTRPLRAIGRVRHRSRAPADPFVQTLDPWLSPERLDSWLEQFYGARLSELDRACARGGGPERFALFRELDDDLWALLLTREYDAYPHIRALLPDVPEPAIQELWNGASGVALAAQSVAFYGKLRARYAAHGPRPLERSRVLDYGCGWGRLTRMLARDVAPGALCGCDPASGIVELCRRMRVPATIERSEFLPESLPFDEQFDLAFAFSVFTHLSERAHEHALDALHHSLRPRGILVVTIRPPAYLATCGLMRPLLAQLEPHPRAALAAGKYLHVAHEVEGRLHPQHEGGDMHYGETVITLRYVEERWSELFDVLDVDLLAGDIHQTIVTLRRR